jgi:D-sedoheptulose 7-phosphate isomerase
LRRNDGAAKGDPRSRIPYEADREGFAQGYAAEVSRVFAAIDYGVLARMIEALETTHREERTLYIAGNGGSASTANHMANDLGLGVAKDGGRGFDVVSLSSNAATLTALGNDDGYDQIFSGQLRTLGTRGDTLLVITGSGNSPNILEAVRVAKAKGMTILGFLGRGGGKVAADCDVALIVPSDDYGPIEDAHMMLDHLLAAYFRAWVGNGVEGDRAANGT